MPSPLPDMLAELAILMARIQAELARQPASIATAVPISVEAKYLDEKALTAKLGISRETAQRWRRTGDGPPFVKLGRAVRYEVAAIERWISDRR